MIKNYSKCLIRCLCFFLIVSWVRAQPMSPDMRDLCDRAGRIGFIPLPESIKSPHPDPLFNAIEMGAGSNTIGSLVGDKNPDEIVMNGMTPLVAAAYVGNWPAAQVLIDKGANVNRGKPDALFSPLMAAIFNSKYSIACKLIEKNATLPTSRLEKSSLLQEARIAKFELQEDAATFVDYLLTNGFDPNDKGTPGETPLMGAVSLSNIPVIKVLLKHGARLDTVTKDGRTVWTVARKKNNPQVLKLLAEAQAKAAVEKAKNTKELVTQ